MALVADQFSGNCRVVKYWIDIAEVLSGREDRVIINIANEWYSWWYAPGWASGYRRAISQLRAAGLQHLLVVDTAGWGQYVGAIPKQVANRAQGASSRAKSCCY